MRKIRNSEILERLKGCDRSALAQMVRRIPLYIFLLLVLPLNIGRADTMPPDAVTNLSALTGNNTGEIDLKWTAPGDDKHVGIAATYIVRYATFSIFDLSNPGGGSWSYRMLIEINNTGSALTDYQIFVSTTSIGATALSNMQGDYDDVRFYYKESGPELNYFIDPTTASCNGFWVRIPNLLTPSTTIYMYYGNANATTANNGKMTFEFFDDFESYTLGDINGQGGWTTVDYGGSGYADIKLNEGRKHLEIDSNSSGASVHQPFSASGAGYSLEVYEYAIDYGESFMIGFNSAIVNSNGEVQNGYEITFNGWGNTITRIRRHNVGTASGHWLALDDMSDTETSTDYRRLAFSWYGTTFKAWRAGIALLSGTNSDWTSTVNLYLGVWSGSVRSVDWVGARKYVEPEPTVTTGSEESGTTYTSNWDDATDVSNEPTPAVAGTDENMTVTGLTRDTTYYFALKTVDEVPLTSHISNLSNALPYADPIPPGAISSLTALTGDSGGEVKLKWIAPGDDGTGGGNCIGYIVKYATFQITDSLWNNNVNVSTYTPSLSWTPADYGTEENRVVSGLTGKTSYWFAIKAKDEGIPTNWSSWSDLPYSENQNRAMAQEEDPPTNVGCSSPANNATDSPLTQTLTALDANDENPPIEYYILLATNSSFTEGLQNSDWQSSTDWNPDLIGNRDYWWKVMARDSVGNSSNYGTAWKFTTEAQTAPDTPTLVEIFSNIMTNDNTPAFKFYTNDAETDNVEYQLRWSTDYNFSVGVTTKSSSDYPGDAGWTAATFTSGSEVTYTVQSAFSNTPANTANWWQVRARDPDPPGSGKWSNWSTKWSFTVDTSSERPQWHQTTDEQFKTGEMDGTGETGAGGVKIINW